MTMIPPKIKKLPGLRKGQSGKFTPPVSPSQVSNKGLYNAGKMVR